MILLGAIVASAQAPAAAGKVGLINFDALAGTNGATRYINVLTALNKEFETDFNALKTLDANIKTKTQELQNLVAQANKPGSPVSGDTIRERNYELEKMKRDLKYKQDDLQARFNNRRQELEGPVYNDIRIALRDYAVKNGFSVILDGAKLEEAGILLAFDNKYDVTKDFITFYNARPAGTGTATSPGN